MANLTGSWLAFRLGVDPVRIDSMRRAGELYAVRDESKSEWLYPSWQFDGAGRTKDAVRQMIQTAKRDRIDVHELLGRRVGLVRGKTVRDLLLNGA